MRPGRLAAAAALLAAAGARAQVPPEVTAFSRDVPEMLSRLGDVVAREEMIQTIFNDRTGGLLRRRVLISDYQVAHLEEAPKAFWEFRFVREVDGRPLDTEHQIADFFRLRHRSAQAERRAIVDLAIGKSLPGCYWHNLTLALLAFEEPSLDNFRWSGEGRSFRFEQVRGRGIPEDFFDPQSFRYYPRGSIHLSKDGRWPARVEIDYQAGGLWIRARLRFSEPGPDGEPPLPSSYEVESFRFSTRLPLTRTNLSYSDYRSFSVTTEEHVKGGK
jgi:hypothetical protein